MPRRQECTTSWNSRWHRPQATAQRTVVLTQPTPLRVMMMRVMPAASTRVAAQRTPTAVPRLQCQAWASVPGLRRVLWPPLLLSVTVPLTQAGTKAAFCTPKRTCKPWPNTRTTRRWRTGCTSRAWWLHEANSLARHPSHLVPALACRACSLVPTVCYEPEYPRTPRFRLRYFLEKVRAGQAAARLRRRADQPRACLLRVPPAGVPRRRVDHVWAAGDVPVHHAHPAGGAQAEPS